MHRKLAEGEHRQAKGRQGNTGKKTGKAAQESLLHKKAGMKVWHCPSSPLSCLSVCQPTVLS